MHNQKNRIERLESDTGVKPGKLETPFARAVCRTFGGDPDGVPGCANIENYLQAVMSKLRLSGDKRNRPQLTRKLKQYHREETERSKQ